MQKHGRMSGVFTLSSKPADIADVFKIMVQNAPRLYGKTTEARRILPKPIPAQSAEVSQHRCEMHRLSRGTDGPSPMRST